MDINWVDKTTGVDGTPVNRKNLMEMQGFSNDTITITETDTTITMDIRNTGGQTGVNNRESLILFKESGMVRKVFYHPTASTWVQITSQEIDGVTTLTKATLNV